MKRVFCLLLFVLILCCAGCSEAEEGTKYRLVRIQMEDAMAMDEETLRQESGGEDLYIRMYDDGTAKLRIQSGDPVDMVYDETHLWREDSPDAKATYTIDDGTLTVVDFPFTYTFKK